MTLGRARLRRVRVLTRGPLSGCCPAGSSCVVAPAKTQHRRGQPDGPSSIQQLSSKKVAEPVRLRRGPDRGGKKRRQELGLASVELTNGSKDRHCACC